MNFYSIRDLRTKSKSIWASLKENGQAIITNNGKPAALMIDISEENFEVTIQAIRQAKAMIAFNNMHSRAAVKGFLSKKEIETEVEIARKGD